MEGSSGRRNRAKPVPENTAVLLREAYMVIERVVPAPPRRSEDTARSGWPMARCFQHLDEGGTTVSALAERAGMTKQAMAELVHLLGRTRLPTTRAGPRGPRAKLVKLTTSGREVSRDRVGPGSRDGRPDHATRSGGRGGGRLRDRPPNDPEPVRADCLIHPTKTRRPYLFRAKYLKRLPDVKLDVLRRLVERSVWVAPEVDKASRS